MNRTCCVNPVALWTIDCHLSIKVGASELKATPKDADDCVFRTRTRTNFLSVQLLWGCLWGGINPGTSGILSQLNNFLEDASNPVRYRTFIECHRQRTYYPANSLPIRPYYNSESRAHETTNSNRFDHKYQIFNCNNWLYLLLKFLHVANIHRLRMRHFDRKKDVHVSSNCDKSKRRWFNCSLEKTRQCQRFGLSDLNVCLGIGPNRFGFGFYADLYRLSFRF